MKITESYLRKIIRGAVNEMFSSSDVHATPSFHDSPPPAPEEAPTQSPQELVDQLVAQVSAGNVNAELIGKLQKAIEAAKAKTAPSSATPFGLGENKKRK